MTPEQKKFIQKWTKLLRIQDIDITYKETSNLKKGWYGQSSGIPQFGTGTIWYRKGLTKKEFQRTIVHEMLHIKFSLTNNVVDGSAEHHVLEVAIETLTRLLLELA